MSNLFSTLRLGKSASLANRLAVAPLTTSQSHSDGRVSDAEARWLERLANDGYGMVITCAAAISSTSIAFHRQMNLGDDRFLPELTQLATRLKSYPTLSVVQLCHGGARAIEALTSVPPHSASAYELPGAPGFVPPRALSVEQIEAVVLDFASAAERAARAGFGGIELHGANGYLFTQFISTMTNLRTDRYGGALENRARFAREVVQACRRRVPEDFIIGFRLSFEGAGLETGLDIDENIQIMNWLASDGIDYGHISNLAFDAPSSKYEGKLALPYIRRGVTRSLPLAAAGGVTSAERAAQALALGADIVAVGRAAIGNAEVPAKLARGEALVQTPFDREMLRALSVSDDFVSYMTTAIPVSRLHIVQ